MGASNSVYGQFAIRDESDCCVPGFCPSSPIDSFSYCYHLCQVLLVCSCTVLPRILTPSATELSLYIFEPALASIYSTCVASLLLVSLAVVFRRSAPRVASCMGTGRVGPC